MSRVFRVWGKKRGNRRSGSQMLGTLGEVLFSSAMFVLGILSLTALILSQNLSVSPPFPPGFGFPAGVVVRAPGAWRSVLLSASHYFDSSPTCFINIDT